MGLVDEGFSECTEIPTAPGQADNFIKAGSGFSELGKKAAKAKRGKLPFQRVGRNDEIPFGSANHAQNTGQAGNICELKIDDIGEGYEFEKEKNPLAGAPIKSPSFFACPQSEQGRNGSLGHGFLNFIWGDAFGEK
jgi:hypothetical protein